MLSEYTEKTISRAVATATNYSHGRCRKELQAAYDKMLDEVSRHFFEEPCTGRMQFRQRMNALKLSDLPQHERKAATAIRSMTANDHMLFNKDYIDAHDNVAKFLVNHVGHFLSALNGD